MWQRFTERARRVVYFAQEEAGQLGLNLVAAEHLLLGALRENDTVASRVLEGLGVSPARVRDEIARQAASGDGRSGQDMQLAPDAKKVIDLAYDEARQLNNNYIGTEHLLLGVIREGDGLGARVLAGLGVDTARARGEVMRLQSETSGAMGAATPQAEPNPAGQTAAPQGMWGRFTENARRVVFFALNEAGRMGENYCSTEHLLLGITHEEKSVAARLLEGMGIPIARIRAEIERQIPQGDGRVGQETQLTPRAKRVVDLAYDEARQLQNNHIGSEHLLLGLVREGEGLAGRVLVKLGVDLERARREVRQLQGKTPNGVAATETVAEPSEPEDGDAASYKKTLEERVRDLAHRLTSGDIAGAQSMDELLAALGEKATMPDVTEAGRAAAQTPQTGDLGVATPVRGQTHVEATRGAKGFVVLRDAYQARDAHGYRALFRKQLGSAVISRAFLLDAGTRVKLLAPPPDDYLATESGGCRVRVLSGPHEGRAAWILATAFVRTGPDDAPFPPPLPEPEGDRD